MYRLTLDTPLEYHIKPDWGAVIMVPVGQEYIENSGIENLLLTDAIRYEKAFLSEVSNKSQLIRVSHAKHSWVRNIHTFSDLNFARKIWTGVDDNFLTGVTNIPIIEMIETSGEIVQDAIGLLFCMLDKRNNILNEVEGAPDLLEITEDNIDEYTDYITNDCSEYEFNAMQGAIAQFVELLEHIKQFNDDVVPSNVIDWPVLPLPV